MQFDKYGKLRLVSFGAWLENSRPLIPFLDFAVRTGCFENIPAPTGETGRPAVAFGDTREFRRDGPRVLGPLYERFAAIFDGVREAGNAAMIDFFLFAHVFAHGPKLLRLGLEDCERLERVDPRFTVEDYSQPFPTMVVELPREYTARRRVACKTRDGEETAGPVMVVVHRFPNLPSVWDSVHFEHGYCYSGSLYSPARRVDELLREWRENDYSAPGLSIEGAEVDITDAARRVAINACMLATSLGAGSAAAPADPSLHRRLAGYLEKARKRGRGVEEAERNLRLCPLVVPWDREILIRPSAPRPEGSAEEGEHRGPSRPHWRRGHIRMQAHGPKHSLRKPILIPAVWIAGPGGAPPGTEPTVYRI